MSDSNVVYTQVSSHIIVGLAALAVILLGACITFIVLWRFADEDGAAAWILYDEYRAKYPDASELVDPATDPAA